MLLGGKHCRSEKGDTIIEVLIAIAVISLIIVGAYIVTNNSLQSVFDAQYRIDATKLATSQVEQLDNYATTVSTWSGLPSSFCVMNGGITGIPNPQSTVCTVAATGTEPSFSESIVAGQSANTFVVTVSWVGTSINPNNNVQLIYRVYPE